MDAGIKNINEAFGFYVTLDMISKHTGIPDDGLLEWSFYKFYTKVAYISHINLYQKRLSEQISRKR